MKNENVDFSIYDRRDVWTKLELIYGKAISNYYYHYKPNKRYTLIYRFNRKNGRIAGFIESSYASVRAAEQAMKNIGGKSRYILIDEVTKHTSHYMIGEKR